ncbi:MAG TPA: ABC transporter ATP-binding protein [Candidatus Angelobacter sp.]|nr:ABC transporter ATP-binding protein [Candidatus Angelobacter sp.]
MKGYNTSVLLSSFSALHQPRKPAHGSVLTWRQKLGVFRSVRQFLRMVWKAHPGYMAATVVLRLLRAVVPIATLWVGKLIIDIVVAARIGRPNISRLWVLVGVELLIVAVGEALDKSSTAVEALLGDLCSDHLSEQLISHAAALDLRHFEDPAFYDGLERAQRQTTGRIGLLTQLLSVAQDSITFFSLAAAVFIYSPWLFVLLLVAVAPGFLAETHFSSLEYSLFYRMTPERRQLDYLRFLSAGDKTAKEVQLFGLSAWLVGRYRKLAYRLHLANRNLALRKGIAATLLSWLGLGGYYAGYVIILWRGFYGVISVGSLTFLAASFARSRAVTERLLLSIGNIYEQGLYIRDLFDFFAMRPEIVSRSGARAVPASLTQGLVFEDVGFQYPGSSTWAVRHINLKIAPGERIALVGENGAGKTTLVKLVARLYDPIEGRILLDGVDLREYDLESLRHAVGVIFQDFVHYDLRLDENIGVGEITQVQEYLNASTGQMSDGDGRRTAPLIAEAAEKSQAAGLAENLPLGYRQMLGRRFEGGVELSGGEWQKIALARAYMRKAQIIILDEPTAALDARAEYETFARFAELVAGQMTLLISHRFSTVRMADRIIVLQQGAILEQGTHSQLLSQNGLYAELFQLQAEGYR